MVELAASNPTAAGGGNREDEMAQRSKSSAKNEAPDDFGHRKSNGFYLNISNCGYGGIGRHARFRILCSDACRFDPCYPHQKRQSSDCLFLSVKKQLLTIFSRFSILEKTKGELS